MYRKLLAMLIYYKHNVHLLHWKTGGPVFGEDHKFLGELYDEMEDHIDQVAELGLQVNENPLGLQEALNLLDNEEYQYVGVNPAVSYNHNDTFTAVLTMYKDIINEIEFVFKNNELNEGQKNDLAAIESWYLLRANYLIPRRLM